MAIDFTGGQIAFESMIDNFSKTLTYTPVVKTVDNITGDETLSPGTPVSIVGAFFRKEDDWTQDKAGLIQNADAILLVKKDVTIAKDSTIEYDGEKYRVDKQTTRRLDETIFYHVSQLFKIS